MTLELFHNHMSTCSQKVRLCLAEKRVTDWVSRHIDLGKNEHLEPAYLSINPNGVVPAFRHDGSIIVESTVMCEYLDEVFGTMGELTPADPVARAHMRAWLRYIDEVPSMAVRVPTFRHWIRPKFLAMSEAEFDKYAERNPLRKPFLKRMGRAGFSDADYDVAIWQLRQSFGRMEKVLESSPWLCGSRFGIADICMVPVLARLEDLYLGEIAGEFGRVSDWYARAQARPSFALAFYDGSRPRRAEDYTLFTGKAVPAHGSAAGSAANATPPSV